jgi:hypothetical protein
VKISSETIEMERREGGDSKAIRFNIFLKRSKGFKELVGDSLK